MTEIVASIIILALITVSTVAICKVHDHLKTIDNIVYLSRNGWVINKNVDGLLFGCWMKTGYVERIEKCIQEQQKLELKRTEDEINGKRI